MTVRLEPLVPLVIRVNRAKLANKDQWDRKVVSGCLVFRGHLVRKANPENVDPLGLLGVMASLAFEVCRVLQVRLEHPERTATRERLALLVKRDSRGIKERR